MPKDKQKKANNKHERKKNSSKKKSCDVQRLQKWLTANGLYEVEIVPDGNCLFRAFSDQLSNHQNNHSRLRQQVVDYLENSSKEFALFLDEEDGHFKDYCERMRQDSIWGGQIEIQAFSLLTGVNVLIHQCSMIALEFLNWPFEFPCVQLAYQGTEHYSSVRVQDDTLAQLARNRKKSSFEQCKRAARFREKPEWQSLAKKLMTVAEIRKVSSWRNLDGLSKAVDERNEKSLCDVSQHFEVTETEAVEAMETQSPKDPKRGSLSGVSELTPRIPGILEESPRKDQENLGANEVANETPAKGAAENPPSDDGPEKTKQKKLSKKEKKRLEKSRIAARRHVEAASKISTREKPANKQTDQQSGTSFERPVLLNC